MSQIRPDSTIKLYKVPDIDTNAGRTGVWPNANDREAYFASHALASEYPCTVIKKRNQTIKVATPLITLEGCNYLSFVNPSYGNKIFYCKIMFTDYLNNNTCLVTFAIDWFITDMFNVKFEATNMLREGLTSTEYSGLSANPFNEQYNDKMLSEEPLLCDRRTERLRYNIADKNVFSGNYTAENQHPDGFDGWNLMKQNISVYSQINPDTTHNNKYDLVPEGTSLVTNTTQYTDDNIFILCYSPVDDTIQVQINTLKTQIINDTDGYKYQPFLLTDPLKEIIIDGTACYGAGRARKSENVTTSISKTTQPLKDTKLPRPYYMIGTCNLQLMTQLINIFNTYDAVSSILSIYSMPSYLLDEFFDVAFRDGTSGQTTNFIVNIPFPQSYRNKTQYDSPKLNHFPFTYMSLDGPNDSGHIELKYEKITAKTGDTGIIGGLNRISTYCEFKKFVSITADGIYVGVVPYDYDNRYQDVDPYAFLRQDLAHGLFYTDFPQIPYTTDAYLTFLAKQAKGMVAADTEYARFQAGNEYGILSGKRRLNKLEAIKDVTSIVGEAGNLAGNTIGAMNAENINRFVGSDYGEYMAGSNALSSGIGLAGNAASMGMDKVVKGASRSLTDQQLKMAQAELVANRQILEGASGYLSNPQEGNMFTENFARAAQAFVTDEYHAGSCSGVLNFLKDVESIGVYLTIRSRSDAFAKLYDKFFKMYGYATKQYKVPSIAWYIAGTPSSSQAPHFEHTTYNTPYSSDSYQVSEDVFYTQTERCKVTGVCGESAQYIENLLNGGVLFVKL